MKLTKDKLVANIIKATKGEKHLDKLSDQSPEYLDKLYKVIKQLKK